MPGAAALSASLKSGKSRSPSGLGRTIRPDRYSISGSNPASAGRHVQRGKCRGGFSVSGFRHRREIAQPQLLERFRPATRRHPPRGVLAEYGDDTCLRAGWEMTRCNASAMPPSDRSSS